MQTKMQGISNKESNARIVLLITEVSIVEEPGAVVPHAGICAGIAR